MRVKWALLSIVSLMAAAAPASAMAANLEVEVLSNRADLVSGGNALVAVKVPPGVNAAQVRVFDDGKDITGKFAVRPNGRFEGLVNGLAVGANVLSAQAPGTTEGRTTITNHANGSAIFSGPQVQPWVCQETAVDAKCNQATETELQYKSSVTGQFSAYDPQHPPIDLATTTTDQGVTVPYIVRVETGYQVRDQFKTAVLYNPFQTWTAWSPQRQWNHKLMITHGASCGIDHQAGSAPDVMNDAALSRGFAVMSTALNNAGHNCNLVTQAESMVAAKERLVEVYGEIRYTIGTGCSGGSLTQQQVANAYPGIYQAILPQCSFPDAWSTGQQLVDYHLGRLYFENPSKWGTGVAWTPDDIAAVEGHPNHVNAVVLDSLYWTSLGDPDDGCPGVPAEDNYNAQTNPDGVRCTLADYMINVFGPRPQNLWTAPEQAIGKGFAGMPLDNVGVQYGLEALKRGEISVEQYVDLNQKIGGGDIDINPIPERFEANQPALLNSYRSGAVNSANNLDEVAIIDLRGPDHGAFHDAYRSWATRARLEREQGQFPRNHVIWMGHVPLLGDPNYTTEGLVAVDRWLAAVEADSSARPLSEKIAANRPSDIVDRCSQVPGVEQVAVPGIGQVCKLQHVEARYATPRIVAGEGVATDTNKCTLKTHRRTDYYPIEFTDAQWARLETAFPGGVCDWSSPGIDQVDAIPWQTYQQDAQGNKVTYGGQPLGPAPAGSGGGWTSEAFDAWRG